MPQGEGFSSTIRRSKCFPDGRFAEWEPSIVERNVRQVVCYRDNVSVTMWSVGNETGHGRFFSAALKAVKALDPGRLTHWERGNREADVDSQMYPSVDWVVKRGHLGEEPLGSRREMPSWTGGAGEVFLNLDVRQTGLGEASCGPEPLPQYRFDPNAPVTWRLFMAPQGS